MSSTPECFVIMPLTDPEGYDKGHFLHVFEDILRPACVAAGYTPFKADGAKETNLIHLDILQRLLRSPLALCDLSTRNPNVLFELGLRQAFDKPVVLVQQSGTPRIFDIAPLRVVDYRPARIYHEVLEDQKLIADALKATLRAYEKNEGINSIVRLLALTEPASLPDIKEANRDPLVQIIRAELSEIRHEVRELRRHRPSDVPLHRPSAPSRMDRLTMEARHLRRRVASMQQSGVVDPAFHPQLEDALRQCDVLLHHADPSLPHDELAHLRHTLLSFQEAYGELLLMTQTRQQALGLEPADQVAPKETERPDRA